MAVESRLKSVRMMVTAVGSIDVLNFREGSIGGGGSIAFVIFDGPAARHK